jgi:hypothetical protein
MGCGPIVEKVAKAFASCAIYSSGDLVFRHYDQFQLAAERKYLTMKRPLGFMQICALFMDVTNSIVHMQNALHKSFTRFHTKKDFFIS